MIRLNFWIKVVSLELIVCLLISPQPVLAITGNAGSEYILCNGLVQMTQSDPDHPTLVFYWTFTSSQSTWTDGVAPPPDPTPVLGPSTQSTFQIQIDDDSAFGSPNAWSGEVSSSAQSYATTSPTLYYNQYYYWRIKVKDSYNSTSDWATGSVFNTYKAATMLKGVRFR
jgi:hypothetical protein